MFSPLDQSHKTHNEKTFKLTKDKHRVNKHSEEISQHIVCETSKFVSRMPYSYAKSWGEPLGSTFFIIFLQVFLCLLGSVVCCVFLFFSCAFLFYATDVRGNWQYLSRHILTIHIFLSSDHILQFNCLCCYNNTNK